MHRSLRVKLVVAGVLAVVVIAFVALGGYDWMSTDGNVERALTETGWVGPAVFVVVMWVTQPFGMPGVLLIVPAGIIWPAPLAIALSWVGNLGASWLGFSGTRWFARNWVANRIPPKLRRFDDRLENGGVLPIVLLRLLTGQIPAADWLLGVSKVTHRNFLIGTGIGIIPLITLFVLFGSSLSEVPTPVSIGFFVAIVVAIATRVILIRRKAAALPSVVKETAG